MKTNIQSSALYFFKVFFWFFMVFQRTGFQRSGFQRTGYPLIFIDGYSLMDIIDGYPSKIFIDGYPSMNIDGYPSMNIDGYPSMNINGYPSMIWSPPFGPHGARDPWGWCCALVSEPGKLDFLTPPGN